MAVGDSVCSVFEFIPVGQKGCKFDPKTLKYVGELNRSSVVCIQIFVYLYIYMHKLYVHIYIYMYMCFLCVYICVYMCVYTYIYEKKRATHVCVHGQIWAHCYMYIHVDVDIQMYM